MGCRLCSETCSLCEGKFCAEWPFVYFNKLYDVSADCEEFLQIRQSEMSSLGEEVGKHWP